MCLCSVHGTGHRWPSGRNRICNVHVHSRVCTVAVRFCTVAVRTYTVGYALYCSGAFLHCAVSECAIHLAAMQTTMVKVYDVL